MAAQRSDARENRAHLVAVARAMANEGAVPSFNALAKKARVGVGTVYRHFTDAAALGRALVEDQLDAFRRIVDEAAEDTDSGRALEQLLRRSVAMVMHQPLVARALADAPDVARAIESKLEKVVARAHADGLLRRDVSVDDFRRLVCGIELAANAGPSPRAAAERYVEIVLGGLRPAAPPKRKRA